MHMHNQSHTKLGKAHARAQSVAHLRNPPGGPQVPACAHALGHRVLQHHRAIDCTAPTRTRGSMHHCFCSNLQLLLMSA